MRKTPGLVLLGLLAAGGIACESLSNVDANEMIADISEFLGKSNPSRHVTRLLEIHDTASFHHVPDVPPTYAKCVEEVRVLATSGYGTWREVALATFFVTRVAVEDQAALNRGEAVRALVRLGGMVIDAEDPAPPGEAATDREVGEVIARLNGIHARDGSHDPPGEETAAECARLVRRIGDLRYEDPEAVARSELVFRLKNFRGILLIVVDRGLADEDRGREAQAGVDRALINIAAEAVRLSLASSVLYDPDARVRTAAADALEKLKSPQTAPALVAAYRREGESSVRRSVVQALGSIAIAGAGPGRDAAVPVLIAALADDDRSVRFNAREGLRSLAGRDLGEEPGPWVEWWGRTRSGS